jgi:hypothetical protein
MKEPDAVEGIQALTGGFGGEVLAIVGAFVTGTMRAVDRGLVAALGMD